MATEYSQVEPDSELGFGTTDFGDEDKEFGRGFGDPQTSYSAYTED